MSITVQAKVTDLNFFFFLWTFIFELFFLICSGLWTLHDTMKKLSYCFSSCYLFMPYCVLSLHDDSQGKTADLGKRNNPRCPAAVVFFFYLQGEQIEVFSEISNVYCPKHTWKNKRYSRVPASAFRWLERAENPLLTPVSVWVCFKRLPIFCPGGRPFIKRPSNHSLLSVAIEFDDFQSLGDRITTKIKKEVQ